MARRRNNPNPARHHRWYAPDGQVYELIDLEYGTKIPIPPPSKRARQRAKALDPNHCALAEQHMITAGVPVAQIGRDKCYIPLRENGVVKVYRAKIKNQRDKDRIDIFDSTNEWPDDEGLWVHGIPPSETLDSRRSKAKRMRERWETMPDRKRKSNPRKNRRDASRRAQVRVTDNGQAP